MPENKLPASLFLLSCVFGATWGESGFRNRFIPRSDTTSHRIITLPILPSTVFSSRRSIKK